MKISHILLLASLFLLKGIMRTDAQVTLAASDLLTIERLKSHAVESPFIFKAPESSRKVGVILCFDDEKSIDTVLTTDYDIAARFGKRAVVYVNVDQVQDLAGLNGIRGAALTRRKYPYCYSTRVATEVNDVHNGTALTSPYNGEGVIVGLYDGGLDPNHISFKDETGAPRVRRIWCYPLYDGWEDDVESGRMPPEEYECNEYITPQDIMSFSTDDANETHGTHVLGILTGSSCDNTAHDYHGMAPGSEIAVACGRFDDLSILKGIQAIADFAEEEGKPCVINLSLGENSGPHDGSDEFTGYINDIAALPHITICVSAGNEADKDISLVKRFSEDDSVLRSIIRGSLPSGYVNGQFEIWSEDDTPFRVSLDIVETGTSEATTLLSYPISENNPGYLFTNDCESENNLDDQPLAEVFSKYYKKSTIGGVMHLDRSNNRYSAAIDVNLLRKSGYSKVSVAVNVEGTPGKKVFIYSPDTDVTFSSGNLSQFDAPDGNGSINSIACGPNTIAVGAYSPQSSFGSPNGTIASFSSWSQMYDGSFLPHIVTPGVSVTSSFSRYYIERRHMTPYDQIDIDGEKYYWGIKSGTSMSCPVMSGIAALWLSADPTLSSDEIREIAMQTAQMFDDTHIRWGAGRVNAFEGLKEVLSRASLTDISVGNNDIMLQKEGDMCSIFCNGAQSIKVRFITLSGTLAACYDSTGDSADISIDNLSDGLYIMNVITDKGSASFKMIK